MQQKQTLKIFHMLILSTKQKQTNLASLKTEVDKLNVDKLVSIPVDLSKLSDLVKNDIVKKDVYNKLVANIEVDNKP